MTFNALLSVRSRTLRLHGLSMSKHGGGAILSCTQVMVVQSLVLLLLGSFLS